MNPTDIAMALGLFIVVDVAKDAASYLIQKGLGKNGNGHKCPEHALVMDSLRRLSDAGREDSFAKQIERAVRRGLAVGGSDPRD